MVTVTPSEQLRALAGALGERATLMKPLGPLTTYGVGGPAALFVEIAGPPDLEAVRTALAAGAGGVPLFVLGRGSNLLVADAGFDGIVVQLGTGFAEVDLPESGTVQAVVRAGGALALPVLARRVADAGWSGLAWAVGVPGSVGGAVRMNAGGHGSDMAACLVRYRWADLLGPDEGIDEVGKLAYGYRSSSVTPSQLVVEAELRVAPGSAKEEQAEVAAIVRWRRQHQPGGSNAGSVFTNPQDDSAGRLIDEAGLKGFAIGTACVSEKHANFIQAERGGRADDVRAVMEHVRAAVAERCGVTLRTEVRLLGFGGGETGAMSEPRFRARFRADGRGRPPGEAGMTPVEAPARRRGAESGGGSRRGGGSGGRGSGGGGDGGNGGRSGGSGGRGRMDPRISARRAAVSREQGRKRLRIFVIGLAGTALLVGAWFLLHTPLFSARVVTVTGEVHESAAQVVAQAGLASRPPLLDVNAGAVAARIEQLPWVRSAFVDVSWPDAVHIRVTEETPRLVVSMAGGRWATLSADGRVLDVSATRTRAGAVDGARSGGRPGSVLPATRRRRAPRGLDVAGVVRGTGDGGDGRAGRVGAAVDDNPDRSGHRNGDSAHGEVRGRLVDPGGRHSPQRGCDRRQRARRPNGDRPVTPSDTTWRRMLDLPEHPPYRGVTLPNCEHQPSPKVQGLVLCLTSTVTVGGTYQRAIGRRSTRGRGEP